MNITREETAAGLGAPLTETCALDQPYDPFRTMAAPLPVPMAQADPLTTRLVYVNPAFAALLGSTDQALLGTSFLELTHPHDREANRIGYERVLRGEVSSFTLEKRMRHQDGHWVPVLMMVTVLRQPAGGAWAAAVLMDLGRIHRAEAALSRREQQLALALRAAGLGLWSWRARDDRLDCSDEALQLVGLSREQVQENGDGFRRLVHPEDVEAIWMLEAAAEEGRPIEVEYRIVRPGGAVRWVTHSAWPADDPEAGPGMIGTIADVTERRQAAETLRQAHLALEDQVRVRTAVLSETNAALRDEVTERRVAEGQVRELLGQIVVAEEEERRRVARELHDGIGQSVTALSLGLKALESDPALPAALQERLRQLQRNARRLDDDIDRLSHELRPAALDDLGLPDALREHAAWWSEECHVPLELHVHGLQQRVARPVETTVYRVVQEALHNVQKHAGATRVAVIVEVRGDLLRAIVEDDGCGFDEPVLPQPGGRLRRRLGLRGMVERAALVGGRLEIESAEGKGTTVYLSVPLTETPS